MAENFYYYVNYHADCEKCGKGFDSYIKRAVAKNDSELLGDAINSFADSVDGMNARKFVEACVKEGRWSELWMDYGPTGHGCPHCGARQSWDPPVVPPEPEKKQAASSKLGSIGLSVFIFVVAGLVIGLLQYIVQTSFFYDSDPTMLMAIVVICAIAGVIFGIWMNKKTGEDLVDTYDERMRSYQEALANYEAFQQEVASRPSRNTPVVDFKSGIFTKWEISTLDELAKAHPDVCPSCGKQLKGQVLANSVHASRVNAGCCPWCGEKLPAARQVRLS